MQELAFIVSERTILIKNIVYNFLAKCSYVSVYNSSDLNILYECSRIQTLIFIFQINVQSFKDQECRAV